VTASLLIETSDPSTAVPVLAADAAPAAALPGGTALPVGEALPESRGSRTRRRRALSVVGEPRFAHASEAELARILDFYMVRWEYEPRTFPILWNLEGQVVESFAPDFYLPDLDLWLELTTLRQSLVRKKNRKLRRLRELYPMLRIKLLYARDFRALMLKYGRLDVAASLIGTDGQVMPNQMVPLQVESPRDRAGATIPDTSIEEASLADASATPAAVRDARTTDVARSTHSPIEPVAGPS
jgi:hypoxanthine phosphoribosyltransferase